MRVLGLDNNLTATATGATPAQITLAKGVVAGTANLLIGLNTEHSTLSAGSIGWALVVGALGYGMSIILWVRSARRLGAARSQGVFATAPFVGMSLGWILTDDPIHASQPVALVVMVMGVALVVTSSHVHEHEHVELVHAHDHVPDESHRHSHSG